MTDGATVHIYFRLMNQSVVGSAALFSQERRESPILTWAPKSTDIQLSPSRILFSSMENLAVPDKLLIEIWPLHISADGMYAISAAVIIVLILATVRRRLR